MYTYWGIWIWPVVNVAALAVIGTVMAPKAGAARGRLWLGIGLMLAGAVVSLLWSFAYPSMLGGPGFNASTYGMIAAAINILSTLLSLAGVAVLASAATVGRSPVGPVDPSRPGAPPSGYGTTGYQGTGYPPGSQQTPPQGPQQGGNPYAG
jgi:hypothetical protein